MLFLFACATHKELGSAMSTPGVYVLLLERKGQSLTQLKDIPSLLSRNLS